MLLCFLASIISHKYDFMLLLVCLYVVCLFSLPPIINRVTMTMHRSVVFSMFLLFGFIELHYLWVYSCIRFGKLLAIIFFKMLLSHVLPPHYLFLELQSDALTYFGSVCVFSLRVVF